MPFGGTVAQVLGVGCHGAWVRGSMLAWVPLSIDKILT